MSSIKKSSLPKRRGIKLSTDMPNSSPAKLERQNDANLDPVNMADSFLLPKLEHHNAVNNYQEAFAYSLAQQPPVNPFADAFQQATQELHPFDLPYSIMPDTTEKNMVGEGSSAELEAVLDAIDKSAEVPTQTEPAMNAPIVSMVTQGAALVVNQPQPSTPITNQPKTPWYINARHLLQPVLKTELMLCTSCSTKSRNTTMKTLDNGYISLTVIMCSVCAKANSDTRYIHRTNIMPLSKKNWVP